MYIIKILANENGSHDNQTLHGVLPDGWAILPMNPAELENFPFGTIAVDYSGAQPVVTEWFAGTMPEEPEEPEDVEPPAGDEGESEVTADELMDILLGVSE